MCILISVLESALDHGIDTVTHDNNVYKDARPRGPSSAVKP